MTKRRILCLLSEVGGAHGSIARVFRDELGGEYDLSVLDLYRCTSRFCNGSLQLYSRVLLEFPRFYNFFYDLNDRKPIWDSIYRLFIARLMKERTKRIVRETSPDAIVSLFALTSRIAADALDELGLAGSVPLVVFVVDPFTVHRSWIEPRAALQLVTSDECRAALVSGGARGETIRLVRYPIARRFGSGGDRASLRAACGVAPTSRVVLLMGGADGVVPAGSIARRLLAQDDRVHVIAVAGKNGALRKRLEKERAGWRGRMTVLGFSDRIHELMALSDLLVTKPGPATIMEAIACELPIIATGFLLRQEEGNVRYLEEKGLGVYLGLDAVSRACRHLFDDDWIAGVKQRMHDVKRSFPRATAPGEMRRMVSRSDEPGAE